MDESTNIHIQIMPIVCSGSWCKAFAGARYAVIFNSRSQIFSTKVNWSSSWSTFVFRVLRIRTFPRSDRLPTRPQEQAEICHRRLNACRERKPKTKTNDDHGNILPRRYVECHKIYKTNLPYCEMVDLFPTEHSEGWNTSQCLKFSSEQVSRQLVHKP
jgi:hypothetical protein